MSQVLLCAANDSGLYTITAGIDFPSTYEEVRGFSDYDYTIGTATGTVAGAALAECYMYEIYPGTQRDLYFAVYGNWSGTPPFSTVTIPGVGSKSLSSGSWNGTRTMFNWYNVLPASWVTSGDITFS